MWVIRTTAVETVRKLDRWAAVKGMIEVVIQTRDEEGAKVPVGDNEFNSFRQRR